MRVKRNFYNKKDREVLDILTSLKKNKELLYRKINKDNKQRIWTQEEYDFMISNWGKLSKKEIAEKLNRSIDAVNVKSSRLGLKNYFVYSEEITLNNLINLIYKRNFDSYFLDVLKRYDFPIKNTITNENFTFRTVKISEFIEWFKKNKRLIDLSLTEEGFLDIEEPEWMKEKRIADKKAALYGPHNKKWTQADDDKLIELVNSQKYGYREISIILKRTEGALKRRMLDLKMDKRPPKAYNHNMWTEEEISTVKDLWLKGYKSVIIAEYLPNRSALAINGILERHKYFGDPPLKFRYN